MLKLDSEEKLVTGAMKLVPEGAIYASSRPLITKMPTHIVCINMRVLVAPSVSLLKDDFHQAE